MCKYWDNDTKDLNNLKAIKKRINMCIKIN